MFVGKSRSSTDLFETFSFSSTLGFLTGVTSSFGKKPVAISAVVANYDPRRGDVEYCDAATNDQVICGELCNDRNTLLLFRHTGRG